MIDNEQDPLVSGIPGFHALHTELKAELKNFSEKDTISTPVPVLNIDDSIFKKMENKETFSSDDVYKIITAMSKKESSKKMIETFMSNLKIMAEESKIKEIPVDYRPLNQRQSTTGRNAYEIRADVLQMAIDWASSSIAHNSNNPIITKSRSDDDLISLAKKFYSFVENRR